MTTMGNAINENRMYDDRTTLYLIYVQEKIYSTSTHRKILSNCIEAPVLKGSEMMEKGIILSINGGGR